MKSKSGKRKTVSKVFTIIAILFLIIIVAAVIFFMEIGDWGDRSLRAESFVLTSFAGAEPMEVTLTAEDKEKDFLYLYNSLKNGCPQAGAEVNVFI